MRVLFLLATLGGVLVGACSGADGPSPIQHRASTDPPSTAQAPKSPSDGSQGGSNADPAPAPPATPTPSDPPPVTPDAGGATTPPAPAGACGNPKCFAAFGVAGCKATDGAGVSVTMGCQDGACACLKGGQTTATFEGDATSAADASQLFLSSCDCK